MRSASHSTEPPRLADKLLGFVCKDELLEEIQGDLYQFYQRTRTARGNTMAGLAYWYHVIHFLRPFAMKKIKSNSNRTTMIRFNLMIAFRNLNRYRFYSFLNISGLAIGLATCFFIALFVLDELSYDKSYPDHDRIFRVAADLKFGDNIHRFPVGPAPMAEAFRSDFPEIELSGKMRSYGEALIQNGDNYYKAQRVFFASQGMLDIFQFPTVYGSLSEAIAEPNTVVISYDMSQKIFGDQDPTGKMIKIDDWLTVKIAAVFDNLPTNSHMHPNVLISVENDQNNNSIWLSNNFYTFFKLREGTDPDELVAKFDQVYQRYFGPQLKQMVGISWDEAIAGGSRIHYDLQPITDIHLHSNYPIELEPNGSIDNVYIFIAIGVFVLLLACINFMNLATARASIRAKEVGVRKVLGSVKKQLVGQFLTESILYAAISMLIALILVFFLLPSFNSFTGKDVNRLLIEQPAIWAWLGASVLIIGLMAGLYPAFYLSRFQPTDVLKGTYSSGSKSSWMRNILVVFQFATSLVLIIGSLVVYQQLNYSYSKDLGFSKDQIVLIRNISNLGTSKAHAFKEDVLSQSDVLSASITDFYPLSSSRADSPFTRDDATTETEGAVSMQVWRVDHDYVPTFDMKIVQGRNFSRDMASDSVGIIINETAARRFGYQDPIGRKINVIGDFSYEGRKEFRIIGVVEDFHYESLRSEIAPVLLYLTKYSDYSMAVKLRTDNYAEAISNIEALWKEVASNRPFEYQFLDQTFEARYAAEKRLAIIFSIFSGLAVAIGCLGLFGLSAFTAEKRKKELGIRKVLGASVSNLVGLLFSEYSRLLLFSIVLAVPVGWYFMDKWLSSFAFRISLGAELFAVASLFVVVIGLVTVSFQSLKAARSNPVDNLKYE